MSYLIVSAVHPLIVEKSADYSPSFVVVFCLGGSRRQIQISSVFERCINFGHRKFSVNVFGVTVIHPVSALIVAPVHVVNKIEGFAGMTQMDSRIHSGDVRGQAEVSEGLWISGLNGASSDFPISLAFNGDDRVVTELINSVYFVNSPPKRFNLPRSDAVPKGSSSPVVAVFEEVQSVVNVCSSVENKVWAAPVWNKLRSGARQRPRGRLYCRLKRCPSGTI